MNEHRPGPDGALLLVMLATLALSFKGILAKFVYAAGTGVDFLLLLRFAAAVPLFWLGARLIHGRIDRLDRSQWRGCAFAGVLFFFAAYCDFTALSYIEAGMSRLILFTFPVFVVLLNAALARRPPTRHHLLAFGVTYGGLVLVLSPSGAGELSAGQWKGVAWALAASVIYALYLVSSQVIMRTLSSALFSAASGSVTFLMMLAYLLLSGRIGTLEYTLAGAGWTLLIAIACTVLPLFMLYEAIRRYGADRASLISLAGPVFTVFFAWLLLDEALSALQLAGFLVTIAGVGLLEWRGRAARAPAHP